MGNRQKDWERGQPCVSCGWPLCLTEPCAQWPQTVLSPLNPLSFTSLCQTMREAGHELKGLDLPQASRKTVPPAAVSLQLGQEAEGHNPQTVLLTWGQWVGLMEIPPWLEFLFRHWYRFSSAHGYRHFPTVSTTTSNALWHTFPHHSSSAASESHGKGNAHSLCSPGSLDCFRPIAILSLLETNQTSRVSWGEG